MVLNPLLSVELSEIFAWSIDFFGLQQGDEFKVIYEEQYIDSVSVGLGKIYAAWFKHAGEEFYAIPFIQDGEESYYHTDGQSLKKAFLNYDRSLLVADVRHKEQYKPGDSKARRKRQKSYR